MTPELLVILTALFVLVLCLGAALAEIAGLDPFGEERRQQQPKGDQPWT